MTDVDVVEWEERMMSDLTLSSLQQEAYRVAVARGQWPRGCRATAAVPSVLATVARRALGEEVTELGAALSRLGPAGPLDPVSDELADVVIVCASIAEALGIDLERAVANKMRVNAGRAKRHSEEGGDDRLTPERLAELRRIAEAATPGPWRIRTDPRYDDVPPDRFVIASADREHIVETTQGGSWTDQDLANARYISTFDPPTVLSLLGEIERLRQERGETHFALYHPDFDWWECQAEDCGFQWEFMEGGDPYEHDMRFCPRCGRRIVRRRNKSTVTILPTVRASDREGGATLGGDA